MTAQGSRGANREVSKEMLLLGSALVPQWVLAASADGLEVVVYLYEGSKGLAVVQGEVGEEEDRMVVVECVERGCMRSARRELCGVVPEESRVMQERHHAFEVMALLDVAGGMS